MASAHRPDDPAAHPGTTADDHPTNYSFVVQPLPSHTSLQPHRLPCVLVDLPRRWRAPSPVRRVVTLAVGLLLLASALAAVTLTTTSAPADAAVGGTRVVVYMPFDGGGRTGLVAPKDHTPRLLGGFSWDIHKGPGAAVKPNMRSFDGDVTLKVSKVANNNNGAGTMVTLDVMVNGGFVSQIRYGHLRDVQVSTSTPAFPPGTTIGYLATGTAPNSACADGTSDGWPYSSSWRVCTTSGIHTHTDFQKACWVKYDNYAVIGADAPIAMLSTALPTANNAACDSTEVAYAGVDRAGEGDFVRYAGSIYRIVGGAPTYVSSWAAVGGQKPEHVYTAAHWATLKTAIPDNTYLRGYSSKRLFRVAGGAPVYMPDITAPAGVVDVDDKVVDAIGTDARYDVLRQIPAEGTLLRAAYSGRIFVVAGGAPLRVDDVAAFGSARVVWVGEETVDKAGQSGANGAFTHLRSRPPEGTYLKGRTSNDVFVVAGGSPQWIDSWDGFRARPTTSWVDDAAIDRAGTGGDWDRLAAYPAEGTLLRVPAGSGGSASERFYRVAGRAPIAATSVAAIGGEVPPAITVAATAVDGAVDAPDVATDRRHAHLRATPLDGTFVSAVLSSGARATVHVFAGGAAFTVDSWDPYGGSKPVVRVDAAALRNAGSTAAPWGGHVRRTAADGTLVTSTVTDPVSGAVTPVTARAAGGALIPLADCTAVAPGDACGSPTTLTPATYDKQRTATPRPADGTVIRFVPSGETVVIAGTTCTPARTEVERARAVALGDEDLRCEATVPSAPTGASAVRGDRSATVTWVGATDDGGSPITGYVVRGTAADQPPVSVSVPADATTATLTGLRNGAGYSFRVVAVNAVGESAASAPTGVVTPAGVPATIAQPYAKATVNDMYLAWYPPDPNGEPISHYVVRRNGQTFTVPADRTRIDFTDLPRGTYDFTVTAVNAIGESVASPTRRVTITVAAPAAPAPPKVTVSGRNVTVSWRPPPSDNGARVLQYTVQHNSTFTTVPAGQGTLTFRNLPARNHYFVVYATNVAGQSPPSQPPVKITLE